MFEASPVLQLLRTDHAPITLGLLAAHLGAEVRTRTAADLYDLLTGDLEELRLHGIDLPRTAQKYCATWVEQGFLSRRASREERTEALSLTKAANHELRIMDHVQATREDVPCS